MRITRLIFDDITQENQEKMQFSEDVLNGLSSRPKKISSKYFYDDEGSQIFQQITQLEEYYPTRTEFQILENCKDILAETIGTKEIDIVELGVGDGHKTKVIINSFIEKNIKVNFYPIDISEQALHLLENNYERKEQLCMHGIVADYLKGLSFARNRSCNRQIVLFLGSNIGNFNREECLELLKEIRKIMREKDFLLIGFDLKKNIGRMTKAYSDSKGVTAKFNLNLLKRINNELGANFNLERFSHQAFYNPEIGAMESYLISLVDQDVTISSINKTFHFDEFEPIHLEYSFKFLEKEIDELSTFGGFKSVTNFKDPDHLFVDALWQV